MSTIQIDPGSFGKITQSTIWNDGPNWTGSQVSCPDTKGLGQSRLFRSRLCYTYGELAMCHVNFMNIFKNTHLNIVADRLF